MLHAVNAWEEDDGESLVVVASNISSVEQALEGLDLAQLKLEEIKISLKAKKVVVRHPVSAKSLDLAVINPAYAGKKNRYAYAAEIATPLSAVAVVKLDLSLSSDDCVVASRVFEPGCTGNGPFFVPNNPAADEDDGFLIAYVHDEKTQESKFLVMDANSPTLEIVAAVKLPGRVPTGFHGLFDPLFIVKKYLPSQLNLQIRNLEFDPEIETTARRLQKEIEQLKGEVSTSSPSEADFELDVPASSESEEEVMA
ncbi:UNVERIFIED_CONTAM: putative carotenoid cleavage dioxygenase 4, chloroplastic [Sesamum calycinum]|uniref:Carotenoid cleavage dioxygenase 4, chloroplastic n=1 Tax=Sesamum calycinum TaxID=2727403 RepID=A0AAW2P6W9_9LAMI